jgi:hypothetical protein
MRAISLTELLTVLVILIVLVIVVLIGYGPPMRRPPSHPMPADDSRILNRKLSRSWGYWFLKS